MKYIILAAAVIFTIFIVVLTQIPIGIEPLTELYFENHTKLPKYLFPSIAYNFSFTIHNLEYINMTYAYNVTSLYQNKTVALDSGTFFLENNQTKTINETFSMPKNFEKAEISVLVNKLTENPMQHDPNLKNITLDLHFWIEEITGPKIIHIPD